MDTGAVIMIIRVRASQIETSAGSALARGRRSPASLGVG
jgi:hypothetical protein